MCRRTASTRGRASSFDQVASGIAEAVQKLLGDPARAVEILGRVVNDGVMQRLEKARGSARSCSTRRRSRIRVPAGAIRTPLIVKLGAADLDKYLAEWFGRSRS
jgi:acyl-CoA hydrolase